jgi:hypothetical protein
MPLSTAFDGRIERKQAKKAQAEIAKMRDPVRGTATVVSASSPVDSTGSASVPSWTHYSMACVVQAEGVPAQSARHTGFGPTNRWPHPDMVLPVTVDRADTGEWVVHWDEVPTTQQTNDAQAAALAAAMRGEPGVEVGELGGIAGVGGVTVLDAQGDPAQRDQMLGLLQAQGIDVDALQRQRSAASDSRAGNDDQLARLEKLGALHLSGVLNDAEFEAQKAKILGTT